MRWSEVSWSGLGPGALAGLAGALILAVTMTEVDRLATFAPVVRGDSASVGFIVLMIAGVLAGAGFGLFVWRMRAGVGETLFWGLVYGVFWWYLGPLTLQPLAEGDAITWDTASAQAAFPVLLGLLLSGAGTALTLGSLRFGRPVRAEAVRIDTGALVGGAWAGLLSAALLGVMLNEQGQLLAFAAMMDSDSRLIAWLVTLAVGLLAGLSFALLYPQPTDGPGGGLIRGVVYGLLWWVVAGLTLVPLLSGVGLAWSVEEVGAQFVTMPGYLLFGAALALFYRWLRALAHVLFSDMVGGSGQEGMGTEGFRVAGRSALAALVGGLLFSLVMLQTDFFPSVADLIGTSSEVAGFFVHMGIAQLIGLSYGLLFRRQSYDVRSALGWGVSYGFFWWVLGPLTLMPIFLGSSPQWTVEAAAAAFPNLIGHLLYGAGLGIMFYILEARYSPWWIPRRQVEAERVARRKEQLLTSAPALWALLVALGLTLPVLLSS